MKIHHHLLLIITAFALAACAPTEAGWLSGGNDLPRLAETERLLDSQRAATDQWEFIAAVFGMGCVLLFVVGTALGTKTRHASRS